MTTATKPSTEPALWNSDEITIRPVETRVEYEGCVELQRETWGRSFSDIVPVSMMTIAVKMGGICLGAFDSGGDMLGFVFGVTGPRDGELAHWSHMLAVREECRNEGVGSQLKLAQKKVLETRGVDTLYWTFDPLVARNAHFNINRLGASVAEFIPDMYGASNSDLHRLGTDRFIARWSPKGGAGAAPCPRNRLARADVSLVGRARRERVVPDAIKGVGAGSACGSAHPAMGRPGCNGQLPPGANTIEVPVPRDIDAVVADRFDDALAWRDANRAAFTRLFGEGYRVVGFVVGEEHGRYLMARGPDVPATMAPGV